MRSLMALAIPVGVVMAIAYCVRRINAVSSLDPYEEWWAARERARAIPVKHR